MIEVQAIAALLYTTPERAKIVVNILDNAWLWGVDLNWARIASIWHDSKPSRLMAFAQFVELLVREFVRELLEMENEGDFDDAGIIAHDIDISIRERAKGPEVFSIAAPELVELITKDHGDADTAELVADAMDLARELCVAHFQKQKGGNR